MMNNLPINPKAPIPCQHCEENTAVTFAYGQKLCQSCKDYLDGVKKTETIAKSQQIDMAVEVKTDIFNAETVAIVELRKAVFEDATIPANEKLFTFAKLLSERQNQFKKVIFDLSQQQADEANKLRATQTQLNEVANKLRAEEREKLRLIDVSYKPKEVVKITKPKVIKVKKPNKGELKAAAHALSQELGKPIPEFMLQQIVVMKGCSLEDAVISLRKSIKESLSMSEGK